MEKTTHCYEIGPDTVCAETREDALAVWCEHTGEPPDNATESYGEDVEQVPDEKPITIWDEDSPPWQTCACNLTSDPTRVTVEVEGAPATMTRSDESRRRGDCHPNGHRRSCSVGSTSKTAGEWAKETGRGFLCSTEY